MHPRANGHALDFRAVVRSVATWRRLYLLRGPALSMRCALVVAEIATQQYRARSSTDGITVCPTQAELRAALGVNARNVERHIARLCASGWIERIGPRAGRGIAQAYQLTLPAEVENDRELVANARSLRRGMWGDLSTKPDA